jgi:DNA polymerase IV
MPVSQAARLCSDGVFLSVDSSAYGYAAHQIKALFLRFSPAVQMVSVDEAFIDVSGSLRTFGSPSEIAGQIKAAVKDEIGITCSVGIGPNKLIAKLASGLDKPDGLTILITPEEIAGRVYKLPIGKLWGVGPVTEKYMVSKGIVTIGDLAQADAARLRRDLGVRGQYLAERARGVDDRQVLDEEEQADEKSISHELTLDKDTSDVIMLKSLLLTLTEKVVVRVQRGSWLVGTVALRLRFADFQTITRQHSFERATDDLELMFTAVRELLPLQAIARKRVRLIGARASSLVPCNDPAQADLFADAVPAKRQQLDDSIKHLRDRFGDAIITRAGTMIVGE